MFKNTYSQDSCLYCTPLVVNLYKFGIGKYAMATSKDLLIKRLKYKIADQANNKAS